ncbi:thiamine phosphate synthase [Thermohalobacter berrensis]|uniref:Thiamine-phosphate synthase n=1 Tax=Thermohalobacter berrensis TaxID=99594 RepID=A0A419T4C8_9FIRM|nr:thiamine phosphate synthase [Thermohalobacter berrensis]RKD32299.1 thiamine-phosphate diphosphorylase [Thermohalobacter berrensis]
MNKKKIDYSLYLVTDRKVLRGKDFFKSIESAIKGGVTLIQLREKNLTSKEFYETSVKVREITKKYNIPLIINDRLDIALAVDADGLHIGNNDLPVEVARKLLGPDKILGYTACNLKRAKDGESKGADYLGVGSVFPTTTKDNPVRITIEELAKIKKTVNIPVVAIGGINEENVSKVIDANVDGVAVVSAILGKDDIYNASRILKDKVIKGR